MNLIHAEVSAVIEARPEKVYAILADYRVSHPAILPKAYFTDLTVEQGGQGAGTVARAQMKVMGTEMTYHLIASEPQPGRVLMEKDNELGVTTTFTVDPLNGGSQSRVTSATAAAVSPSIKGRLEQLFNPLVMRRIYRQELRQLAAYVRP
ncbi:MAG TPA: SRPBCC family protein [Anaerolineae bacterium]|nr:SRPBCC family protein [Anaerolineae bacterium]